MTCPYPLTITSIVRNTNTQLSDQWFTTFRQSSCNVAVQRILDHYTDKAFKTNIKTDTEQTHMCTTYNTYNVTMNFITKNK